MALSNEEARAILIHSKCCCSCENGKSCGFDNQPKKKQVWFSNKVNVYYLQLAREFERLHIPEYEFLEYAKSFFEGKTNKIPKGILLIFRKHQRILSEESDLSRALVQGSQAKSKWKPLQFTLPS